MNNLKEVAIAVGGTYVGGKVAPDDFSKDSAKLVKHAVEKGGSKDSKKSRAIKLIRKYLAFKEKHRSELYPLGKMMINLDKETDKFSLVPSDRIKSGKPARTNFGVGPFSVSITSDGEYANVMYDGGHEEVRIASIAITNKFDPAKIKAALKQAQAAIDNARSHF